MSKLADMKCIPCSGDTPKLGADQIAPLLQQLDDWEVVDEHHLRRALKFPDFQTALDYVNRVGAVAEEAGHHPDLYFTWGKVRIEIFTHAIDGLSEADFVLAAKIDEVEV